MRGKKSYLMTFIIYGFIIYIAYNMIIMGAKKIVSNEVTENFIKTMTKDSILSVSYVMEQDKNSLDRKSSVVGTISKLFAIPMYSYSEQKIAVNVADGLQLKYFDTSIYEENTNEGVDNDYNTTERDNNIQDGMTDNNVAQDNDTEETQNPDSGEKVTEETNATGKIKDIRVEDMTYEYLMGNFYTVVSSTTLKREDINAEELMGIDMKLKGDNQSPQILIYHTHGQEAFVDSTPGDTSTTIIGVGDYLTKLLTEQYGYNVMHLTDSFDYVNGVFDRHKAYDYAYEKIAQVLADNPSIEVVIDLHRDGVGENTHLVTEVNGKPTAKIMFFNGISRLNDIGEIGYLYNPYRKENLAFSLQMKVLAEEYYEGFARRNYIQAYQYNLHLRPKSTLIEVGAQTNTVQEEMNAMEPLARILHMTLSGE